MNSGVTLLSEQHSRADKVMRDMDLIRKICAQVSERTDSANYASVELPEVDPEKLVAHIQMLHNAGMLDAIKSSPIGSLPKFMVRDLTWEGYDFYGILANDNVWSKLKETFSVKDLMTLPLTALKTAGVALAEQYVKAKLGI